MAKRDKFADRRRGTITFGADASAGGYESFQTGMNVGRTEPFKWVLLGATVGPNTLSDTPTVANGGTFHMQILIGTHTTKVASDNNQLVQRYIWGPDFETSGAMSQNWPAVVPILSPIPIFASTITIWMAALNHAAFNSKEWGYELWFVPAPVADDEIVEYLAAYGQV